jgi:uncharacterized protein YrzB (UPF0473 family)
MEKVTFATNEQGGEEEFYVLEKTKINGMSYLLVAESQDEDCHCLILKEIGNSNTDESEEIYAEVMDDTELLAVSKVFEELLEDVEIQI